MIYRVAKIVNFSISPQKTKKVYANSCISYYFQPPWRSGKGLSSPAEREAEGERTDRTDSGTNLAHARRQEARQIPQKKHSIIRRVYAREALTSQAAGPPPQPRLSARQLQGLNFQSAGLKIQSAGLKIQKAGLKIQKAELFFQKAELCGLQAGKGDEGGRKRQAAAAVASPTGGLERKKKR